MLRDASAAEPNHPRTRAARPCVAISWMGDRIAFGSSSELQEAITDGVGNPQRPDRNSVPATTYCPVNHPWGMR